MTDPRATTVPQAPGAVAVPLRLLIVRRDHGTLFDYLKDRLGDVPDVLVLIDRRTAQRRGTVMSVTPDRRAGQADRRHVLSGLERDRWESLGYRLAPPQP